MPTDPQLPTRITSARVSRTEAVRRREVRYLLSMGVRTACFVAAIVVHGPARWVLVIAAFILPYVAVVIANAPGHDAHDNFDGFQRSRPLLEHRPRTDHDDDHGSAA